MKLLSKLCMLAFGLSTIQCVPLQTDYDILISVGIEKANLNQEVYVAYYNLWALNSTVQLPINDAELVNVEYLMWSVPASNSNTKTPVWYITEDIPSEYFNDQDFLAFEMYNEATTPATYIGGQIFTVAQVKQQPHSFQFELLDKAGNVAGQANASWN